MNTNQPGAETQVAVLLVSPEGTVLDAHEGICSALGWSREELLNKSMNDLFEYGGDLVMSRLAEPIDPENAESVEGYSISALVRRQDQTNFPVTAIVRAMPAYNCFAIGFDDLPVDVMEASAAMAAEAAPAPASESEIPDVIFAQRTNVVEEVAAEIPAEPVAVPIAEEVEVEHAHANGNGNGNGNTTFRNIFLSADRKNVNGDGPGAANGHNDLAAQLETERLERRRLEGRVIALNDQLQQLHVQLKNNLELESIYHKRVSESEEDVRKAGELKTAAEAALLDEKKKREEAEAQIAALKADFAKHEKEKEAWQREWLSKLQASLAALQDSDAKLEKEMAGRRGIGVKLQLLQQDFGAHADKKDIAPEAH